MQYVHNNDDSAFEQGYEAYAKGYNSDDNPYANETKSHLVWHKGWLKAVFEIGDLY